ncbi:MAG TPA: DNA polymerase III subunit alpha [Candidatus Krumholzibacteria bacterium]|nr:DNA polymerase III subunit alpha [Candidatus Krumholzibacteria bacterium]HRX51658.1 DNA polymerase III subunit alpha [Candidatus Krumholzibacteria bacterium]
MPQSTFVHLHNHSDYSLLDGAMKAKAMAARAAEFGQPALALTDHGNMFGAVEFYLACRKAGIKPILGMEAYVCPDHTDRSTGPENRPHHTVLLARNEAGWRNLMKLSSLGFLEGFYFKPRIDKEQLAAHSDGLLALSACLSGEPNRKLKEGDMDGAIRAAASYRDILGKDNYFLEIQDHGIPAEARVRELMPRVSRETGVPIVCTNDCHYLERTHAEAHDILLCIGTNRQFDDPNRWRYDTDQIYLKSSDEMLALFKDWPDACARTLEIAERCSLELELGRLLLPEFPLPPGFSEEFAYLAHLARAGLTRRYGSVTPELEERFEYEMGIIKQTGYAGYFLIVWDFINAARERDIPVGPGRGSAAGSLVCYCLGITDIDPIANKLLFERFLNPERISMPDIDVDFCFEKRPEIIRYVEDKYGRENVSQIITFGTMAARGVIKDVSRVLGFAFGDADRVSKMVPEGPGVSLRESIDTVPGFKDVAKESPRHDMLLRNSLVLEGMSRNPGIHAAGVLITPSPLTEHIPMYKSTKDDITSQFDMRMVEEMGLLKMDFLGLRTLTVIDKALKLIRESCGSAPKAEEIPMDDPETYTLLQQGRTVGVFQLESSGMQELLRKMKPTAFEDIVAVNALFRPGPLGAGMDEVYVECKHGRKKVTYPHEDLRAVLEETNGVILYQEQVMQIASLMGGFTLGQADTLRKAMGKKKKEIMADMKVMFLDGAQKKGYDKGLANKVFDDMAFFAEYGFNKSHSASYAVLSIQTAWLKAHHPAEFMAATMSTEMGKSDRITQLIDEVKVMGLAITPPDVNAPRVEFAVQDGQVVFGMGAVRGVGAKAIEAIAAARDRLGRDFADVFELCESLESGMLNRKTLESLVNAGALDGLPGHRRQKLESLDLALQYGNRAAREKAQGMVSLFGTDDAALAKPALVECEPHDPLDQLSLERNAVGFFLSGHPFQEYREFMDSLPVTSTARASRAGEGAWVDLAGVITSHTEARDRHKRLYARTHFEDREGMMELTVYASLYETAAPLVKSDRILVVGGRVRVKGDGMRELVADRIVPVDEALAGWSHELLLRLDLDAGEPGAALDALQAVLRDLAPAEGPEDGDAPPAVPLIVEATRGGRTWLLRSRSRRVALSLDALRRLRVLPGLTDLRLRCGIPAAPPRKSFGGGFRQQAAVAH